MKDYSLEQMKVAFMKNPFEVQEIINVCKREKVPLASNMFLRTKDEVEKIIKLLKANNIPVTGSYFQKPFLELEKILNFCQSNNINIASDMLFSNLDNIEAINDICKKENIPVISSMYKRTSEEVQEIINMCKVENIDLSSNLFRKNKKDLAKIITTCKNLKIEIVKTVFRRTPDEIIDITAIFMKYLNILPLANAFTKKPKEVEKIIRLCLDNNIEITGSIFQKQPENLESTINFLKDKYNSLYLKPLIITKDKAYLEKVFAYLDNLGLLEYVINSPSILTLTLEDIKNRMSILDENRESIIVNNKFNPIFSLSKKRLEEEKKTHNK